MPNTDKWPIIQQRYNEPLPVVLARLLTEKGWKGTATELGIDISTVGEYMRRGNVQRRCVYVVADNYTDEPAIDRDAEAERAS